MKKVFAKLAGKVRRLTSGFREKPDLQIDDYVLEHFLLYNGLVGSSPDNQPLYKDVRNEIVQAINDGSGHQLAIALKLSPLWWEDRLEKIFGEIAAVNKPGLLSCLLAERPDDDITGDTTCLSHSDWQVLANAARMLAFLDVKEAVPRLAVLLPACGQNKKAAFCHLAYSLAKLGSPQAMEALIAELSNEEPWFCVDVVGALSYFELSHVIQHLSEAMLSGNELDDYMAVAITRRHNLAQIAEFEEGQTHSGLAEICIAILKGLEGPFHSEAHLPGQLEEIRPRINELAMSKPSARLLASAIRLNRWFEQYSGSGSPNGKLENEIRDLSDRRHYEAIKQTLQEAKTDSPAELGELKHALSLAEQFKLTEFAPYVIPLLSEGFSALPEAINCIASLGDLEAVPGIAGIVEGRIDLDARCRNALSAHPVLESDKQSTDIYWTALKAFGALPHKRSLGILSKAVNDHAPDKREQALLSLQNVLLAEELRQNHYDGDLEALIRERTQDPAVSVQTAALKGIAQHGLTGLIPEVLKSLQSREVAVHRRAVETLLNLAANGHRDLVKSALESAFSKEYDSAKKARLNGVLQQL